MKRAKRDRTGGSKRERPRGIAHPDHSSELPRLNRIGGQLDGIKRMIQTGRYCPDIIQQIRATRSALLAIEMALLEVHLNLCVKNAVRSRNQTESAHKIQELVNLFRRAGEQGISL